ncbi:cellulose-binding domain-containing protein [Lentzea sp. BCCO 10_0856]|uniref:Cellulose-binding domain-containing protein n=1 Tax=Lentzea miocenica TaxID=3095431 RepID=A0ABU4TCI6_9PSEU|nr:cellulose-binding domain-containing protein [Lentzea sp. BCCO 10_0856]MDX8035876.1 cellulose-binding domain-containing protein [Lentzea sp. BCCO 10_0856]
MVLLTCACTVESPAPPVSTRGPVRPPTLITDVQENVPRFVREVVDGRTVLLDSGERVRISLLAPPAECWAAAAIAFATKALVERPVRMTSVIPGEVNLWLEDGTDYAMLAVREGVLRAQGAAGVLADAEAAAARENRGLWGLPCNGLDVVATTAATSPKRVQPPKPVATTTTVAAAPPVVVTTAPPPPPAAPPCTVAYRVSGQWPGGFQGGVTIRNTGGAAINGWTLQWSFGDGQTVSQMWNASSSQRGAKVSATNVFYTATIAPGREVSIGFLGSFRDRNTAPASFTLNGTACATS